MSEAVFTELLEEAYKQEFSPYNNSPVFITSRKHNRNMKRIFRIFEKNSRRSDNENAMQINYAKTLRKASWRTILIALLVAFLAVLSGCTIAYIVTQEFCVHSGNNQEIGRDYMYSNYLWTHDPHMYGASQSCVVYDDYYSVEYDCDNCGEKFYDVVSKRRHAISHN